MPARLLRFLRSPDALTFLGRGIQYFSQLVMVLVIPKALAPAKYAELNLLLPLAYLGMSFVFSWLIGALSRYVFELFDPANGGIRQAASVYFALTSLVLLCLYAGLTLTTDSIYSLVPLLLVAAGLKNLVLGVLNTSGNHAGYFSANLGFALALGVFVGFCFYREDIDLTPYLTLYAVIDIAVSLVACRGLGLLAFDRSWRGGLGQISRYFRYGVPLVMNSFAIWIMSVSDRYLLDLWESKETVAGYILSYQLGGSIITVPMSFAVAVILPRIIRMDKDEGEERALVYAHRLLVYYLRFMVPIFVIACAVVLPLKYYFYPAYHFDPAVLAIIVLAHVIYGLIHFYNKEFELNGRTIVITKAMAAGAAVNVIFNVALIPWLGTTGAAISTLLAYALSVYSVYRDGRRQRRVP